MRNLFLFILSSLLSIACYSQIHVYSKVCSIDSTSLDQFYVIKIKNKKNEIKTLFSEKTQIGKNSIKVGKKYLLEIFEINFDKFIGNDTPIRESHIVMSGSKLILEANERAYQSNCLRGIDYIGCGR